MSAHPCYDRSGSNEKAVGGSEVCLNLVDGHIQNTPAQFSRNFSPKPSTPGVG